LDSFTAARWSAMKSSARPGCAMNDLHIITEAADSDLSDAENAAAGRHKSA
jgi:hypothetical protein